MVKARAVRVPIVAYMLVNGFALCQTAKTPQRPAPAKSVVTAPTSPISGPHYLQGPLDSKKGNLGPNFLGHDPEAIVAEIRESGASKPKSEFETTAQYQARRTMGSLEGRRYVFVVDPEIGFHSLSGAEFAYDADEQVMTARLQIHKEELYDLQKSGGGRELNYALITKHAKPIVAKAIGTNVFGASVAITEYGTQEHGIALLRLPPGLLHETEYLRLAEAKITIPMKADQAERLKPNLRFAVVGIVSEMRFLTTIEEKQATLSHPTSVIRGTDFIPIIPEQLLLFDFKTGEILKRVDGTTRELSPSLPGSPSVSSLGSGTDIPLIPIEKPSPPSPPKARTHPSQSTLRQSPVSLPPSQMPKLEKRVAPTNHARIQGTVRFTAIIGQDGTVQNLQLVSGHPMLVQSATDAVRQWIYKPTLLNGEAVEVITQIDVNFTLNP